jgi:hypothetical protein
VTDVPVEFACCKLAVANFATSVAITAGVQYWIVADTASSGTGSDFNGVWSPTPPSKLAVGINEGSGWFPFGFPSAIRLARSTEQSPEPGAATPQQSGREKSSGAITLADILRNKFSRSHVVANGHPAV